MTYFQNLGAFGHFGIIELIDIFGIFGCNVILNIYIIFLTLGIFKLSGIWAFI
jgi:hypothetical protein